MCLPLHCSWEMSGLSCEHQTEPKMLEGETMLTNEGRKTSTEYFSSMLGGRSHSNQELTALCKVSRLLNIESKYVSLLSLHFCCLAK